MPGPLDGYKVIDISAVVSGPLCAQVLGDQGAEVIKIEPPGLGDITRAGGFGEGDIGAMFVSCNRGKRSICLDLEQPEGIEIVHKLAAEADVFIQNFRPGAVDRMGIGLADLHAINPGLIYVSISGFGPTGPYSQWRVYDPIIQAISGVVSVQRSLDIPIPDLVRTIIADKSTALTAAQAVTAALLARERGQAAGQHIEVPMIDALLYFLWPDNYNGETFPEHDSVGTLLHDVYRLQHTADGHLVYFLVSDSEWHGVCHALNHPEWWEDPRFSDISVRANQATILELGALLDDEFRKWNTADILPRLLEHEVPAAPINGLTDVFTDPQVVHNESIHTWEHHTVGATRSAKPAARFSDTPSDPTWSADNLGQSTEAILGELGYNPDAIAALIASGVTPQ